MKKALFFCYILSFSSCISDKENIYNQSQKALNAIKANDFKSFRSLCDNYSFNTDSVTFKYNFQLLSYYFKILKTDVSSIKFTIGEREPVFKVVKVSIPIFSGFDSTSGNEKITLNFDFRPPTPYSKYSKIINIYPNFKHNSKYRDSLLYNNLLKEPQ